MNVERLREALRAPDFSGTKYRLIEPLGSGGMGAVYLGEDTELGRRVAIKVMHLDDPAQEARVLASLEHPGIVPVHDSGRLPDGRVFYAMKYVEGRRLVEHRDPAPLRTFLKVCEAVAFAHSRGVVHRDLKPENIMIGSFGEALIMDWGIARWHEHPEEPGVALGTPGYMAPEQARGEPVDPRADIYALGAILRLLLPPPIPRRLEAICRRATAEAPEDRYPAVTQLAADVARYLDGQPVSAYRENLWERAGRLAARHRVALLLVLAYLLMRTVLFFFVRR
ncbi:MAG: serine/threonine protein kinase [Acidobacteria bacterium]|nr:serine/threonine protein kinase [Acidobacteriota bacterium]